MSSRKTVSTAKNGQQGSSEMGEPLYIAIGRLGRPHGLNGEAILYLLTDFPERIVPGKEVFIGEEYLPQVIESVRKHKKGLILSFEGIIGADGVDRYKNNTVFVPVDSLPPLPEGEYYHHQLVGLDVYSIDEKLIGNLSEIIQTGANDVYVVKKLNGGEELIPAIQDNLIQIDIENHKMVVKTLDYYDQG